MLAGVLVPGLLEELAEEWTVVSILELEVLMMKDSY